MTTPLMPMATAVWLVDNTSLTFEQIAEFCGLHVLQVRGIADGEVAKGILGTDPTASAQLTKKEIERCEAEPSAKLKMNPEFVAYLEGKKKKKGRYTPVARRQNKPDVIAWLVQNYPEVKDTQIVKLIGTTKKTIESVRDRSHWNWPNIVPKDPVLAGFCTQYDLNRIISVIEKQRERRKAEQMDEEGGAPAIPEKGLLALFANTGRQSPKAVPEEEEEYPESEEENGWRSDEAS
jgi:hypothetical protein